MLQSGIRLRLVHLSGARRPFRAVRPGRARLWSLAIPKPLRRMGGACFSLPSERSSDVRASPGCTRRSLMPLWNDETMLRRNAIASLLATGAWTKGVAWAKGIDRLFAGAHGACVLVDRKTRRLMAAHALPQRGGAGALPGSTLKPLVLNALLERGLVRADDGFPCPGDLRLGGRSV